MACQVKVPEEYASWFTALIKDDLSSATQVARAVAALREEGPHLANLWSTGSRAARSIT